MIQPVNLTPHPLHVIVGETTHTILPTAPPARADVTREQIGTIDAGAFHVPLFRTTFGAITGLPEPEEGVVYLVSNIVAQAVRRDDVLIVDDMVRDGEGRILGCRAFARV
jgi:hypothetical protein